MNESIVEIFRKVRILCGNDLWDDLWDDFGRGDVGRDILRFIRIARSGAVSVVRLVAPKARGLFHECSGIEEAHLKSRR